MLAVDFSHLTLCIYKVYTLIMMTTKIQRWGNSLAIRLPKAIFQSGKFAEGAEVTLEEKGSEVILKVVKRKYPTLL